MPQTLGARTGLLSPYRVLDLTDHRGALAGRIFAQLGADVVQVEPASGIDARRMGPFAPDGRSMTWAALGAGKRSLVLDPERSAHRELLRDLVARADFVLESRAPGEPAWLGPEVIEAANPAAIHVRITPFGLTGPKAAHPATDLTLWAAGGPLAPTAVDGNPPVRMSVPQAWAHAAADAVGGALVAHFARLASGAGQEVEVSALRSATQCTLSASLAPAIGHKGFALRPSFAAPGSARRGPLISKWQGRDGLLEMPFAMGPATGTFTNNFFALMRERGALSERFFDWDFRVLHTRLLVGEIPDEALETLQAETAAFLRGVGGTEAVDLAIARKLLLAPIATVRDLVESPHLAARDFFETCEDGEGRRTLLPGPLARTEAPAFAPLRPAPQIGEHSEAALNDWLGGPDPERAPTRPAPEGGALAGLKVLDLAWVVAGPMVGRNLSDHGATVLRVESSRRIEAGRNSGPYKDGVYDPALSALFQNCNAGKRGLCLDLTQEAGRDVVRDLVAWADVVVESFAPGRMEAWGLGYETLRAINPGIILLSSSLMGQTGPWAKLAGFGNVGAAMSGAQALAGVRGRMPVGPSGPYTDFVGPRYGLALVLAALDWRRRTGQGCALDLSQGEAGIHFLAPAIADYAASGRVAEADGCRDPEMAPHGVFPCAPDPAGDPDGAPRWLALAVRDDADWARLTAAIGREDWAGDPALATLAGRKAAEAALEAGVAAWTAARTVEDAEAALVAAGLPAHRVASYDDLWADKQLSHDGHWLNLPHPLAGETWVEACRFRLSATPGAPPRCAPTFGRDRDWALAETLGYDVARIAALEAGGTLA